MGILGLKHVVRHELRTPTRSHLDTKERPSNEWQLSTASMKFIETSHHLDSRPLETQWKSALSSNPKEFDDAYSQSTKTSIKCILSWQCIWPPGHLHVTQCSLAGSPRLSNITHSELGSPCCTGQLHRILQTLPFFSL